MRSLILVVVTTALLGMPSISARAGQLGRLFNTGCRITASHSHGCFLTSAKGPGRSGSLPRGSKEGKACGYNVLALFSWGDLRITTAMKQAGIQEISAVDYTAFELVPGFYGFSKFCTVVRGE